MSFRTISVGSLIIVSLCTPLLTIAIDITKQESQVAHAQATAKPRIAVLDFDFASTGLTGSGFGLTNSVFGSTGPAKGVSNLLANKLVQDGTYSVIERSKIKAVLGEQDLGASGRVDASTAAEIGRVLGVEKVIVGTITKFNVENKGSNVGVFGIGVGKKKQNAIVALTARMIDTTTSEIVAIAEGEGSQSQRVQVGIFGSSKETNNLEGEGSQSQKDSSVQVGTPFWLVQRN